MRFYLVPVLISLFLNAVFSLENTCPEAEDIDPCTCDDHMPEFITFTCQNIYNVDELRRVFLNADGYNYASITIRSSSLPYFPHEMFERSPAKFLILRDTTLIQIFDSPPERVDSITEVNLISVTVARGILWNSFQGFTNMEIFRVQGTAIGILGASFSQFMSKKLSLLAFIDSEITKIEPGALSQFSNLRDVIFNNCSITNLTRDIFPRPCYFSSLMFDNNKITSLSEDLFTDMPNILSINLENNLISELPESTFSRSSIEYLFLGGNPLKCNCKMQWLLKKELVKGYAGGKCASPKRLSGKDTGDLTPNDFHCQNFLIFRSESNFTGVYA